ncbi:tripartite tricarboxylate transporter TctB family protein [Halomonas binhaiensis]|uniref:Tripartite tricarboxylate transporter TctB family protein n=1 Tax=Halomonas binhaiensis TaxID=2562282 RepID=A0A5C1NHG8_9GAMM|nr:tripartite tricarboxylate transporter TctB family protein [Halomonas binhaiensis]QEM83112.1 tripartite tricarboxylate transporter TctB family protein [Halomonas binhaiensis]
MNQYKTSKIPEVAFPAILFATSLGYLAYSLLLGAPVSKGLPSPLFFPTVLGAVALLLSTTLLYRAIRSFKNSSREAKKDETKKDEIAKEETTELRPALIVIATIAYISIFNFSGYFLSSLFYIFCIISIFSDLKKPLITAVGSIIITAMGLVVFEYIFRIRLPGILG